ncbi:MAG TPA: VOC family protein [Magnetospirillaceae bacterium]|jgi:hypothetical protein
MSFKGKFVWYELMTTDIPAAEKFYSQVVGWIAKDAQMPGMKYTIVHAGEIPVGGIMSVPMPNMPSSWIGYIAVDDVDAEAAAVKKDGGVIHKEPTDIPNVGRFAVVGDPTGAGFCLFKGNMDAPPSLAPNALGAVGWHELHAGDGAKAWEFYAKHFGWIKDSAMDMGAMGVYQLFKTGGDQAMGGMMTKAPQMPVSGWLYYFNVDSAAAAAERVTKAGGKIANGPMEVPGGQWIVQCFDPQGAMFAVVSAGK